MGLKSDPPSTYDFLRDDRGQPRAKAAIFEQGFLHQCDVPGCREQTHRLGYLLQGGIFGHVCDQHLDDLVALDGLIRRRLARAKEPTARS